MTPPLLVTNNNAEDAEDANDADDADNQQAKPHLLNTTQIQENPSATHKPTQAKPKPSQAKPSHSNRSLHRCSATIKRPRFRH